MGLRRVGGGDVCDLRAPAQVNMSDRDQSVVRRYQFGDHAAGVKPHFQRRPLPGLADPNELGRVRNPLGHVLAQVGECRVSFLQELRRLAGDQVDAQQSDLLLQPILHLNGERAGLVPTDRREVFVLLLVPFDPNRIASADRDNAEAHAHVLPTRAWVELLQRLLVRPRRVGDVPALDARVVHLLEGDEPRVGRPPVTAKPAHLLLGDELRETARLYFRPALRHRHLLVRCQVVRVHVVVADVADHLAVARPLRVENRPGRVLQLAGLVGHPVQDEQFARQWQDQKSTGLVHVEVGKPPGGDAHPLAAGLLLGGRVVPTALEQGDPGGERRRLARGHVELEQAALTALGRRAEEQDVLAVGRRLRVDRAAELEPIGLGVEAQEAGVERLGHGLVGAEAVRKESEGEQGDRGSHGRECTRNPRLLLIPFILSRKSLMTLNPEHLAPRDSVLARRDPRWRLAAFVLAVVGISVVRSPLPSLAALVFALFLAAIGRVPGRWHRVRIGLLLLALVPFLIVVPFTVDRGLRLWEWRFLHVTDAGVLVAITLVAKSVAIVTVALALLATAPLHVTLAAAGRLGLPKMLVQLTVLTYRYVFLLADELNRLRIALRVRGFRNAMTSHAYRTVGRVTGTLIVRGADRAERVAQAMRCRAFDGRFRSLTEFRTKPADVLMFLVIVAVTGGLVAWDVSG